MIHPAEVRRLAEQDLLLREAAARLDCDVKQLRQVAARHHIDFRQPTPQSDPRRRQQARAARLQANPDLAPHGVEGTYNNWCCRCDLCRAEHSRYEKAKRARRLGRN